MASTGSAMLKAATSDLGFKEGKSNDTKFGKWYGLNYNPYCDMAISYWAEQSGNADVVGKFAYCPSHVNWFKARGQWHSRSAAAKAGDIVFFDWDGDGVADHVGIVEKDAKADANLTTIEANTSAGTAGSQSNGDGVYRRTRYRSSVLGFGRPAYKATSVIDKIKETVSSKKPKVSLSAIIYAANTDPSKPQGHASRPADTKLVEGALKAEGLLAAKWAADGSYGTTTITAYGKWQRLKKVGRPYDGIPGKASLTALGKKYGFTVTK
ncbi:CHAP domain-containing protein [Streptomyces sp. DSM 41014]|uniref:CHAP domain-containing protein n=1 Tax=Streptomyces hintoniae TaxID=3075521 RepID=A0ABU2UHP9_9ACTN|nr:CHAP domain-containing protein [Streptomyces sp. DSM 41014]MDT0472790.1 CHAP domain-containing protein [Streptomyces sp. DSM 41014]